MSYVDAVFDRDQDIIKVVERVDGKRRFHEYPVKYTFYYKELKGKHKSIYGDPFQNEALLILQILLCQLQV